MRPWRQRLAALFREVLADLDAGAATAAVLPRIVPDPARTRLLVVAFGKAARPMANAVVHAGPWRSLRGLVVPPEPDTAPLPPFAVLPGGHPLPTAGSLAAGTEALALLRGVDPGEVVLLLVSGGGSALLEVPIAAVPLEALRSWYQTLVGCGAGIADINAVRSATSVVKGGGLWRAAQGAAARHTIAVSDVPPHALFALASGAALPPVAAPVPAAAVLDRLGLWPQVPPELLGPLRAAAGPAPEPPAAGATDTVTVALDGEQALAQLMERVARLGLRVVAARDVDDRPYDVAAARLIRHLDRLRRRHPSGLVAVAAVGEVAVRLGPRPGSGGRNQQFALAAAGLVRGRPIALLSGGSDGVDGNSAAAGAVADGSTWARARRLGLDPVAALQRRNTAPLFAALGDALQTGPTATNVRDLRVLVHCG